MAQTHMASRARMQSQNQGVFNRDWNGVNPSYKLVTPSHQTTKSRVSILFCNWKTSIFLLI